MKIIFRNMSLWMEKRGMMNNRKKWNKGVFTVEAAVIVPMSVSIIALLIGYCYFAHQINWFKGAAYEAAAAGLKYQDDPAEKAKERICERTAEMPVTVGNNTTDVSSGIKLAVSFEGKVLDDVFGGLFGYRGEAALTRFEPVRVKMLQFVLGKAAK